MSLPGNYVSYGSDTNCTLAVCPVEASVLGYRPSVGANATFVALFAVTMILHFVQGLRWRQTLGSFTIPIIIGCIDEILGYIGRLMMYGNPFSFNAFLMEIICITTAPVFFTASIYVTLARTINFVDPSLARFNPKFLYWFFIPCDIISLVFQAVGGALSSTSDGNDNVGVDLSLFGLAFQVFTLVIFIALSIDYMVRYQRSRRSPRPLQQQQLQQQEQGPEKEQQQQQQPPQSPEETNYSKPPQHPRRLRIFVFFLALSILLILIRCAYRIDELSEGYSGKVFSNEGLFYGLESVMVVVAIFCLNIGHPGFGLQPSGKASLQEPESEQ